MQVRKHRLLTSSLFGLLFVSMSLSLSAAAQTTAPNEWTRMQGHNVGTLAPVYGTMGTPAGLNIPEARYDAATWTDKSGNLWLFGGAGSDPISFQYDIFNTLWEYIPSTNEWAWMGGSNGFTCGSAGNCHPAGAYGTLGEPAPQNFPGGRYAASWWTDNSGNFWLFGGQGFDASDDQGWLNDLWEFNPVTSEWTWMGGSNVVGGSQFQPGVYGTLGTFAKGNVPGSRSSAATWTDSGGDLWLFGGIGFDSMGNEGFLNDLWQFNPSTKEWAWMGGKNTAASCVLPTGTFPCQPGAYGTKGMPAAGNIPGGREPAATWADSNGNFWLFGGNGDDAIGQSGVLNDLWELIPSSKEWTWMSGDSTIPGGDGSPGIFGTLGEPSAQNVPGARGGFEGGASAWTDDSGNFWLFGGQGCDASTDCDVSSNGVAYFEGFLNDIWVFKPTTSEWTWMGGSSLLSSYEFTPIALGEDGTLQVPNATNLPWGRSSALSWTDSKGIFWLFGGDRSVLIGEGGNDLWEYQPSTTSTFPTAATPTFSLDSDTYTSAQTVNLGDLTLNASIYYTTDGTTPTTASTPYTSAITVSATETIKEIAIAPNYLNSAVASATYTINLIPDFSVLVLPASFTIPAGQSGSAALTVTPLNGFNSSVSFGCSNLPAGASCSFSPTSVTPPGTASTTLTVTASATSAAVQRKSSPLIPASAFAAVLCCFGFRKRQRLQMLLLLAVSVAGLSLLNGCGSGGSASGGGGGGGGSHPVTSTVTVTATSGSLVHSTTFTLTVD